MSKDVFSHYGLDLDYLEKPKPRPPTLSMEDAVKRLCDLRKKPSDGINLLENLLTNNRIGLYCLHLRFFKPDLYRKKRTIEDIESLNKDENVDFSYSYNYKGLIRVHKEKHSSDFKDYLSTASVEHLCNGARIKPIEGMFIPQRSLRELILGVELITHFEEGAKNITINDLRLLESEFDEYADAYREGAQQLNLVTKQNEREKVARQNGQQSGEMRKELGMEKWARVKPHILEIARSHDGGTPNFIATTAARANVIQDSEIRNIARYIQKDQDCKKYLRKK